MRDYKKMSAHFLLRSYLSCNRARLFGMVVAVLCGVTHRKGTTSTLVILWGQIWGVFFKKSARQTGQFVDSFNMAAYIV